VSRERLTWAEIDLSAIRHNVRVIRQLARKNVEIMAVVKADAYGHGSVPVAKAVVEAGADRLGVASLSEAIELREAGVYFPIQILGCSLPEQAVEIIHYNLAQTVSNEEIVYALSKAAVKEKKIARIHVKVDTGMGRVGVAADKLGEFVTKISAYEAVRVEGIMTHLPCADEPFDEFTPSQIKRFAQLISDTRIRSLGARYHAANSAGIVRYPASHFDLVRPGLMIYGATTVPDCPVQKLLKPALSLRSQIVQIREMREGDPVSYGSTHRLPKDTLVAVVPIGYADGFSRALSNKAWVLVNGKRAPVIGRVCMDQCLIDVGEVDNVHLGDIVTLIGTDNGESIRVEDVAAAAGTIPHEILCTIGKRVERVYRN